MKRFVQGRAEAAMQRFFRITGSHQSQSEFESRIECGSDS